MIQSIAGPLLRVILFLALLAPVPCAAQAPAASPPPPAADTPSIKVGVLIFADYTIQQQPKIQDTDGNEVTYSSFNIGRGYINITGNVTRNISFRLTPDITRETGVGSALNGSYTFRLKFAFAQWGLDDHLGKGSFARFGMQPTPWVEFIDAVYRYRFQGATFEDREGFLPSSDTGAAFHYSLPRDYGDVQAAVFNGETFARAEVNDQKSVQLRGTLRPAPGHGALHGLRFTGFYDKDAYVKNADRRRAIAGVTFEHPHVHAAFTYLDAKDQTSATKTAINARAWSAWITPRTARGWEGLLRFDHQEPNTDVAGQKKDRFVAGGAYWFPHQGNVATALMLDVDQVKYEGFSPVRPTERRIGVHALVSF
jgi:hypothetical protein